MKKIKSWAIVVEWGHDNGTWNTETITEIPDDVSQPIDDWLTEYESEENKQTNDPRIAKRGSGISFYFFLFFFVVGGPEGHKHN